MWAMTGFQVIEKKIANTTQVYQSLNFGLSTLYYLMKPRPPLTKVLEYSSAYLNVKV